MHAMCVHHCFTDSYNREWVWHSQSVKILVVKFLVLVLGLPSSFSKTRDIFVANPCTSTYNVI